MIFTSTCNTYFIMYIIYIILMNNIVYIGLITLKNTFKYTFIGTKNMCFIIFNKIYDYDLMNKYKNKINIIENNDYLMVNIGPAGN